MLPARKAPRAGGCLWITSRGSGSAASTAYGAGCRPRPGSKRLLSDLVAGAVRMTLSRDPATIPERWGPAHYPKMARRRSTSEHT
ncbi:exported hypothetical protein [uncultured Mycobacterium sp.]|uniref:Uncharacterized protein n=1 Tax=uncultured Mycobacterium sp. TaxID=171292 RepID=A0A1Y5NZH6_9MYCO|nr:exported hypothetical protein [uncultured Mycobacterium sp.]